MQILKMAIIATMYLSTIVIPMVLLAWAKATGRLDFHWIFIGTPVYAAALLATLIYCGVTWPTRRR